MNNIDDDGFFDTLFSFAVVIRGNVDQIQQLKKYLMEHKITIAYQKTSTNKIFIKEEGNEIY